MKNKLMSVWSIELDEYMEERYGIDIGREICDEVQKAIWNEIQKRRGKTEMNIRRRRRIIRRQNRRFWRAIARKNRRIAKLKKELKKLDILESQLNEIKED